MVILVGISIALAYVFLLGLVLLLNYRLYKQGEALAEARLQETRAKMIVGDLVADERRREQAQERHVREWLA